MSTNVYNTEGTVDRPLTREKVEQMLSAAARADKLDLSRQNLSGIDLSYFNLAGANLLKAKLLGTDLQGTNLSKANLYEAHLNDAILDRANLEEAYLRGANLWSATLNGANLDGADLDGVRLTGAKLINASLRGANLHEANLHSADLSNAKLSEAILSEATLIGAILTNADLYKADLSEADLDNAKLEGVNLCRAQLSEAILRKATLTGANLDDTDLHWANLNGVDLSRASMIRANLYGANLHRTNLSEANLSEAILISTNLTGTDFTSTILHEVHIAEREKEQLHDKGVIGLELTETEASIIDRTSTIRTHITKEPQLSLFAIARANLEEDDRALVGKMYIVQAGISQNISENFEGEPADLPVPSLDELIWFDILLHTDENIEVLRDWQKPLFYIPRNPEPQLVEFYFRPLAPGDSSLVLSFYHRQRWLRTVRLKFETVERARFAIDMLRVGALMRDVAVFLRRSARLAIGMLRG